MFPLVALLACFGLVMIYRIDEDLAREQAQWFVVALGAFCATIVLFRDYRKLEQYRYTIAAVSIGLLFLPRVPGIGGQTNGAFLAISVGPITFQPAEFAKIGIVIFLASYLRDNRQVLVQGARRVLGVTIPPLKQFGPLLVVWGAAMFMLVFIRDLGSSLMFFGAFLALLYIATNRLSFVVIGMFLFVGGRMVLRQHRRARAGPRRHLARSVQGPGWNGLPASPGAVRAGGRRAVRRAASANRSCEGPGATVILPAPHTDFIYAVIVDELGLVGATAVILIYLLIVERGFKTALLARDSFSTLLAAGLTSVFALQVFVIVGGVTRVIPLTGVTLPFVSYGGSSIVANFVLLALLLLVSDRARRPE